MWDQATSRSLISVIIRFRSNKWHPSENNLKPGGNLCAAIIYANASGADLPDYVTFWCLLIRHFCGGWHSIVRRKRIIDRVLVVYRTMSNDHLLLGPAVLERKKSFGHDGENSLRSEILKVAYQASDDLPWSLDYSKHNFLRALRSDSEKKILNENIDCMLQIEGNRWSTLLKW